jgi:hypothetical protein
MVTESGELANRTLPTADGVPRTKERPADAGWDWTSKTPASIVRAKLERASRQLRRAKATRRELKPKLRG